MSISLTLYYCRCFELNVMYCLKIVGYCKHYTQVTLHNMFVFHRVLHYLTLLVISVVKSNFLRVVVWIQWMYGISCYTFKCYIKGFHWVFSFTCWERKYIYIFIYSGICVSFDELAIFRSFSHLVISDLSFLLRKMAQKWKSLFIQFWPKITLIGFN
jgi:hypothetical protein